MAKLTIHDLFEAKKQGRTFTEIRTSDLREAIACAEAGVEIIMCMKEDLPVIRPAVPEVFIIAAHNVNLPTVCGPDQAVGAAFELERVVNFPHHLRYWVDGKEALPN